MALASGPCGPRMTPEIVGGKGVRLTGVGARVEVGTGAVGVLARVAKGAVAVTDGGREVGWVVGVGGAAAVLCAVTCAVALAAMGAGWVAGTDGEQADSPPSTNRTPNITHVKWRILFLSYIVAYGSAASRRPSPKKLKPSTATTMNAIGERIQAFWPSV